MVMPAFNLKKPGDGNRFNIASNRKASAVVPQRTRPKFNQGRVQQQPYGDDDSSESSAGSGSSVGEDEEDELNLLANEQLRRETPQPDKNAMHAPQPMEDTWQPPPVPQGPGDYSAPSIELTDYRAEKAALLDKIDRLESRGFTPGRRVSHDTPIEDLRAEAARLRRASNMSSAVAMQSNWLLVFVRGIEWLNTKAPPHLRLKLDGLRESFAEQLDSFQEVFEQMYSEHGSEVSVSPFIQLVGLIITTIISHHVTSTMYGGSLPSANEVMADNPGIVQAMLNNLNSAQVAQAPPPPPPPQTHNVAMDHLSSLLQPPPSSGPPGSQSPPSEVPASEIRAPSSISSVTAVDEDAMSEVSSVMRRGKASNEITIDA